MNLAIGGHKQPQQLMTVTYLLAQGVEFDIILNIDGFNEVALYPAENSAAHVYPWFPRAWHLRSGLIASPEAAQDFARITRLNAYRNSWAKLANRFLFRYLASWNVLWLAGDRYLTWSTSRAYSRILDARPNEKMPFVATGPLTRFDSENSMYAELVRIWKRCSLELALLSRSHGIRYYHFLQPNQYTEPAKTWSDEERMLFQGEESRYRKGAVQGYPYLRSAGSELASRGVNFHDLSSIFSDIKETIYVDKCCHFTPMGNQILAEHIAAAILGRSSKDL